MKNLTIIIAIIFIALFSSCKKENINVFITDKEYCISINDTTLSQKITQNKYGIFTDDKKDTLNNKPYTYISADDNKLICNNILYLRCNK